MKILHTSDLHIDSPLTTRLDSKKVRERKSELLFSFRRMTEEARREGAAALIIAGDLFDSENIGKRTLKSVLDIISLAPEITFFYLSGNHERNVLYSCGIPLPENLKLFEKEWTYYNLDGINFIGRTDTDSDMFGELRLNASEINVLVLHGELREHSDIGGVIGKKDLNGLPIDYLALGHYHSYSHTELSNTSFAVYCGTPEPRGFDECGECGYVMIDADKSKISHRFVKSAKRAFRIVKVNVMGERSDLSLLYKIEKALAGIPSSDLVRIVLTGERELGQSFNKETLLSSVSGGYYYAEIKDETVLRISPDDFKNDISLKGEFIRGVLSDDTLSDTEKERVISLGLEILLGEVR